MVQTSEPKLCQRINMKYKRYQCDQTIRLTPLTLKKSATLNLSESKLDDAKTTHA